MKLYTKVEKLTEDVEKEIIKIYDIRPASKGYTSKIGDFGSYEDALKMCVARWNDFIEGLLRMAKKG